MVDLGANPGDETFGRAIGLDTDGASLIAGYTDYYQNGTWFRTRGFRWKAGQRTALGILSADTTYAMAVNNNGQIVGYGLYNLYRGVKWVAGAGTGDDLLALNGASGESYAFGLNDAGRIVGKSKTGSGTFHAFATGGFQIIIPDTDDFGVLPGGSNSDAADINAFNEVTGSSEVSGGQTHAYVTKRGYKLDAASPNNPYVIAPFTGGTLAVGYSISDAGRVVGYSTSGGGERALYWDNFSETRRNLSDPAEVQLSDSTWTIYRATSVNEEGKITGWGLHNGFVRAFLLDPIR